jgi:large subunit ribosomal protein L23
MKKEVQEKKITAEKKEVIERYVLKSPHISEKATELAGNNFYVFKVEKVANKRAVKEEVEKRYKVNVLSVRIINIPSKKRRVGKTEGTKKGYKKAVVKIKEGQEIDITA